MKIDSDKRIEWLLDGGLYCVVTVPDRLSTFTRHDLVIFVISNTLVRNPVSSSSARLLTPNDRRAR